MNRARERELCRRMDADDPDDAIKARNELVEGALRSCEFEANRLRHRGCEFDDLLQAGAFGLLQAANHFDPARNVKFATFARWHVRGAMLDEIHRQAQAIRTPHFVSRLRRLLDRLLEADPTASVDALAEHTGTTVPQVEACLRAGRVVASLDEHASISETLAVPEVDHDLHIDLMLAMDESLTKDQRQIVQMRLDERTRGETIRALHRRHAHVIAEDDAALATLAEAMA